MPRLPPFHPDDPTDTDLSLLTSEIETTLVR
ncbi:hypothetical protein BDZ31_003926 [Conexibacter arvalis]|uniref:Uncharacterized protein n=1 Tax=Conexibacter arvalis TaxID=912552 RepID=A0A840IJH0_9ACTN|nr:hypothetical protein [Conexibacter arvalis]